MEAKYITIETEEEDVEVFNELMSLPELVEVLVEEEDTSRYLATVDSEALADQTRMDAIFKDRDVDFPRTFSSFSSHSTCPGASPRRWDRSARRWRTFSSPGFFRTYAA